MKDVALSLAEKKETRNEKLNILREYLQALILRILQTNKAFQKIAFIGGTALRILHGLPRFSEDLDFSLIETNGYCFEELLKKLKNELASAGYIVSVSYNIEKTVNSAFIKFETLLFEAEISGHKSQKLAIKLEVDTKPPEGANTITTPVLVYFPVAVKSFDMPSLFAGKCHAILSRKYTKGRDFFDLGWYLTLKPPVAPNIYLLKNSLQQTAYTGLIPEEPSWKMELAKKVESADWNAIEKDVTPFLEHPGALEVYSKQNLLQLLLKQTGDS